MLARQMCIKLTIQKVKYFSCAKCPENLYVKDFLGLGSSNRGCGGLNENDSFI